MVMFFAILHLRLAFKVMGHNARFRVDADKCRSLRVVLVESRQFRAKRFDVWRNHGVVAQIDAA